MRLSPLTGSSTVRTARPSKAAASLIALAIGSAAILGGASPVRAQENYAWNTFTPSGTTDYLWTDGTKWTASTIANTTVTSPNALNYPGGDPSVIDDVANISLVNGTSGGAVTIDLNTPLAAPTIASLTLNMQSTVSANTDILTLNLNANLATTGGVTVIGGASSGGKYGRTILNTYSNLTVGGTFAVQGSDGNGAATVNIGGVFSAAATQIKDDGDNINVLANATNVNLGAVSIGRSANASKSATDAGLHLLGGTVTASSFLVGSNNSGGVATVDGANLTIASGGAFIVGDNSATTARYSAMYVVSGNVNATGSTLVIAGSTGNFQTQGNFTLSGGKLNVAGIQLTNTSGPASDIANFNLAGGTAYVGASGIGTGTGTANFISTGGTVGALASWSSPAKMNLSSNATTFQSADASNNPFDINLSGALSGSGSVVKTGSGKLILSGANTYSGGTTVNAGTLVVNNTTANATVSGTGTGAVTISGGNLAGSGTILGLTTVGSGSHLAPGNNNVGTLTFGGGLTLSSGSILDFDFNASANSLINVTAGSVSIGSGVGIDLYAEGTTNPFTTNGTYNLIQVTGTPSAAGLSILNGASGVTYLLGTRGQDITVTISGGTAATGWAVDASGSWGNASNWNGPIPNGTTAILGNVLTAHRTVTLDGTQTVPGVEFNSPVGYSIAQGSGGSLVLSNGASAAAITDFAGPQIISAPVTLNSDTTLSTTNAGDTVTISGAIGGTGNLTVAGLGTTILTNTANTYGATNITGNLQVGSGASTGSLGSGTVVNSGVLTFNSSSNMNIATVISGTGGLTQAGTGVLTLSANNTYTGTTNIVAGTLQYGVVGALGGGNVNVAAPGKLDLNGLSVTLNSATGNGTIDNTAAGNVSLTFNGSGQTFGGTIQNTGGNLSVVASASGTLTLSGNNSYSGGTTVTSNRIAAGSNTAFGTGPLNLTTSGVQLLLNSGVTLSNPIVVNNGTSTEFVDINGGGISATLASNVTMGSTSSQYRIGTSNATNTLHVTGTSNASSATTILTRGTLAYQGNGSLTSTNSIAIGRQSASSNLTLTLQDNAFIRGNGVNLGGLNGSSDDLTTAITLSGNSTLDAGTGTFNLMNSATASANITLTTNDNSTLRGAAFTATGSGSGALTFWVAAGGNLVATANNPNFMPASSKLTVALAGTLNINDGGFNIGIAQPFIDFGGGAINKTGTGSLTLSGANAYGSGTTVSTGALYATNASALGTGGVVVNSGATFGGIGTISNSLTLSPGSHLAPGAGATLGTLTLPGGISIGTGSTIDYNFAVDGSANSILELASGSISHAGATTPIDLYMAGTTNPFAVNGNYTLVNFDGGYVDPSFAVANPASGATYSFSQSGNNLVLTISGGLTSAVWGVDSDGSWGTAGSWTGGVPNGVSALATFGGIITAPRNVTLDGNKTVGSIAFANANAYTINPGTGGTLTLDNGANGNATINDTLGSHTINVPMTLNSNTTATAATGTTLTLAGAIGGAGTLTTSGAGNVALGGANTFAGLTAAGTGTVIISGASTYSGPTTISSGKVQLNSGGTLGNGLSALSVASGATLDLNGQSATVGSLTGAGTIDNVAGAGASVLTTGGLNANVSFTGVIKNTTGTVALVKTGTGSLTLTGNSTFSGGTTLTSGGLYVNNTSGSGLGTGTVTLNGGILGGTGTIGGAVTGGTGGTINPGTSTANSVGKLTVASLTTSANTTLAFDLSSPTGTSDVLAVSGAVTLNGGKLAINSQSTTGTASLGDYKVLTYTGTLTGSTANITLPAVANNIAYTLDTTHDANTIDIHRGFIGDATDDGVVDLNDLNTVLNHLGVATTSWNNGNFDGAATIDLNDLNDVLNHLGTSVGSNAIVAEAEALVAAGSTSAVPEPTSLGILALGAAALISRRRKA